jgi:flagellar biosynthesis GTPase FlhF
MLKKVTVVLLTIFLLSGTNFGLAQESKGTKGANEKAYEHANENAIFHRVGDWFATLGKSPEEKKKIKAQRKAERQRKRMEKRAKEEMEKEQKKMPEEAAEMKDKAKQFKNKMKKNKGKK